MSGVHVLRLLDGELDQLISPQIVRQRAKKMLAKAEAGGTAFKVDRAGLAKAAKLTLEVTLRNYPDVSKIPFHSRWEHFRAGGHDRVKDLDAKLAHLSRDDRARAKIDLAVISVLLDAGAGAEWKYHDASRGTYTRSEGLAVASLEMFLAGAFSSDPVHPYQADANGLEGLSEETLARGFQADQRNPLIGLEGRASLLRRLGDSLRRRSEFFPGDVSRPGNLLGFFKVANSCGRTTAEGLLNSLLLGFQDMWPARTIVNGVGFGDLWNYDFGGSDFENLMPFHKLSQWLSYSLVEPMGEAGREIVDPENFTGLPEYRNGGLLLDTGALTLRDPKNVEKVWEVSDPLVIEWRALTVALLDELGAMVCAELNMTNRTLPLGKVLQGGTWAAGRETAQRLRGGQPPLQLHLDGTVF